MTSGGQLEELIGQIALNTHLSVGKSAFEELDRIRQNKKNHPNLPQKCETVQEKVVGGWRGISCKFKSNEGRMLTLQVAKYRQSILFAPLVPEAMTTEGLVDYEAKLFGERGRLLVSQQNFFAPMDLLLKAAFLAVIGREIP